MSETDYNKNPCSETIESTENQMEKLSLDTKPAVNYKETPWYLPFSDYFMSICYLTAARSKDPVTKVGACIVSKDNRVLSVGYNGMPRGVTDYSDLPWGKHSDNIYETKYPYVCHAEMNAIMNLRRAVSDFKECCIYTSKFPCPECAKLIIQSGLGSVVYSENKPEPFEIRYATMRMFELAGITCTLYEPSIQSINISLTGENKRATCEKFETVATSSP